MTAPSPDLAGIDALFTDDELAIRDSVRTFLDRSVTPHVAGWFEAGEIPDIRGLAREMGALGLLGMTIDGYGCAGLNPTAYGLACVELEACDSGIRSLVSVQSSLCLLYTSDAADE